MRKREEEEGARGETLLQRVLPSRALPFLNLILV
jgi:hypothetical protein